MNLSKRAELEERVRQSYLAFSQQFQDERWHARYHVGYILGKLLTDYALFLSASDLGRSSSVLNVGCSEPIDEAYFAARVGRWVALDLLPEQLARAMNLLKEELSDLRFRRVVPVCASANRLPFVDHAFDAAVAFSSLDHIPSRDARAAAIGEMCRVVRPGGYVLITVPSRSNLRYWYVSSYLQRAGKSPMGYEYVFWPWEVPRALRSRGLKIEAWTSSSFNPYSSLLDKILKRLRLAGMFSKPWGERLGFLGRRPFTA